MRYFRWRLYGPSWVRVALVARLALAPCTMPICSRPWNRRTRSSRSWPRRRSGSRSSLWVRAWIRVWVRVEMGNGSFFSKLIYGNLQFWSGLYGPILCKQNSCISSRMDNLNLQLQLHVRILVSKCKNKLTFIWIIRCSNWVVYLYMNYAYIKSDQNCKMPLA